MDIYGDSCPLDSFRKGKLFTCQGIIMITNERRDVTIWRGVLFLPYL